MQLVLAHVKQGLEAVGKETSDTHATDSSTCDTASSSASSQVICTFTVLSSDWLLRR